MRGWIIGELWAGESVHVFVELVYQRCVWVCVALSLLARVGVSLWRWMAG